MTAPEHCTAAVAAGADFVVIGTALEHDTSMECLQQLIAATRQTEKVVNA